MSNHAARSGSVRRNTRSNVARKAAARTAAAHLVTDLLLARCRSGADSALLPRRRWMATASADLLDWLRDGGFASEPASGLAG
jgi:hypothetical protein